MLHTPKTYAKHDKSISSLSIPRFTFDSVDLKFDSPALSLPCPFFRNSIVPYARYAKYILLEREIHRMTEQRRIDLFRSKNNISLKRTVETVFVFTNVSAVYYRSIFTAHGSNGLNNFPSRFNISSFDSNNCSIKSFLLPFRPDFSIIRRKTNRTIFHVRGSRSRSE